MEISEMFVLIPALDPGDKLIGFIEELRQEGFTKIIVVDDGSSEGSSEIFKRVGELGCEVIAHEKNLGKGAAIKTALRRAEDLAGGFAACITADADGQHLAGDVRRVAEKLAAEPEALVLGVRDMSADNVPLKSRLDSRITSVFFRLTCGIACPDTQTGLRGIPEKLFKLAISEEGDRFEYEMNFLMDAVQSAEPVYVPIETVYENNNRGSHFRPAVDSFRVYGRFLRFVCASLSGSAVDFILFYILSKLISGANPEISNTGMIFAATVIARIAAGLINFLMNHFWSFKSHMPAGGEAVRYAVVFVGKMLASAAAVAALDVIRIPTLILKMAVDLALFFISYRIQKNWVFRQEMSANV